MAARTFAEILKDSPDASDVHINDGGRRRTRKPRTFAQVITTEDPEDVAPPEKSATVKVAKVDAEHRLIFGWASVVTKGGQLIVDKQGDVIEPHELEPAAYAYVKDHRGHGHMHDRVISTDLVESMMFTAEKQKALGVDLGQEGWWVGFYVGDDAVWQDYKEGKLPEFSIGGMSMATEYDGGPAW
jgi:hypothetical protein